MGVTFATHARAGPWDGGTAQPGSPAVDATENKVKFTASATRPRRPSA